MIMDWKPLSSGKPINGISLNFCQLDDIPYKETEICKTETNSYNFLAEYEKYLAGISLKSLSKDVKTKCNKVCDRFKANLLDTRLLSQSSGDTNLRTVKQEPKSGTEICCNSDKSIPLETSIKPESIKDEQTCKIEDVGQIYNSLCNDTRQDSRTLSVKVERLSEKTINKLTSRKCELSTEPVQKESTETESLRNKQLPITNEQMNLRTPPTIKPSYVLLKRLSLDSFSNFNNNKDEPHKKIDHSKSNDKAAKSENISSPRPLEHSQEPDSLTDENQNGMCTRGIEDAPEDSKQRNDCLSRLLLLQQLTKTPTNSSPVNSPQSNRRKSKTKDKWSSTLLTNELYTKNKNSVKNSKNNRRKFKTEDPGTSVPLRNKIFNRKNSLHTVAETQLSTENASVQVRKSPKGCRNKTVTDTANKMENHQQETETQLSTENASMQVRKSPKGCKNKTVTDIANEIENHHQETETQLSTENASTQVRKSPKGCRKKTVTDTANKMENHQQETEIQLSTENASMQVRKSSKGCKNDTANKIENHQHTTETQLPTKNATKQVRKSHKGCRNKTSLKTKCINNITTAPLHCSRGYLTSQYILHDNCIVLPQKNRIQCLSTTNTKSLDNLEVHPIPQNRNMVLPVQNRRSPSSGIFKLPEPKRNNIQSSSLQYSFEDSSNKVTMLQQNKRSRIKLKRKYDEQQSFNSRSQCNNQSVTVNSSVNRGHPYFFDSYMIIDSSNDECRLETDCMLFKKQFPKRIPLDRKTAVTRVKRQYQRKQSYFQPQTLAALALQTFFGRR